MGGNEQLALDANFSNWKNKRALELSKEINQFEYYCLENYLRDWVDTDEELKSGMVNGSKDGGVDGMYFFVNRELVSDSTQPIDPATVLKTALLLFQIKEGDGFSPVAVDKLDFFTDDLLDLSRREAGYHSTYSAPVLKLIRLFKERYKQLIGGGLPEFEIHFLYMSKKDVEPNADCLKSEAKLKATVRKHFNKAEYSFDFVSATRLWNFIQGRPKNKKILRWVQQPLDTPEGFIGLVKLSDYYDFLKNEDNGELSRRIFESNVRGFWPKTPINKEILKTLEKAQESPEFWLLNNGITILAGDTSNAGHLQLEIHDPQVVNGLQSSRVIYDYCRAGKPREDDGRRILVRIIKLQDEPTRDRVIRSTNNQNKMPIEALRATDPIHRQIEEIFSKSGLYYDRRKGHHKDSGKPISKIVSIVELLQAMLSCLVGRPDHARARPRNYFGEKAEYPYEVVFGEGKYDLNVYLKSILIFRKVEAYLDSFLEPVHKRNLIFYVCMYFVCTISQHAKTVESDLLKINTDTIDSAVLATCYNRVLKTYNALADKHKINGEYDFDAVAKGSDLIRRLASNLNRRYPNGPKLVFKTS